MTVAAEEMPRTAGTLARPLVSLAPTRDRVDLRKCRRRAHKLLKERCKQGGVHAVAAGDKGAIKAQRHINLFLLTCKPEELRYLEDERLLTCLTQVPMGELLAQAAEQAFEVCTMAGPRRLGSD